ncbi:MAG: hypothetical protein WDO56_06185 [Gammaproteobacteria bacterium]
MAVERGQAEQVIEVGIAGELDLVRRQQRMRLLRVALGQQLFRLAENIDERRRNRGDERHGKRGRIRNGRIHSVDCDRIRAFATEGARVRIGCA